MIRSLKTSLMTLNLLHQNSTDLIIFHCISTHFSHIIIILVTLKNYALLGYYAASSGNFLPTFRDNLSAPFLGGLKMGLIGCPETSVRNYHYSLRNNPEERISHLLLGESLKSRIVPLSSQLLQL